MMLVKAVALPHVPPRVNVPGLAVNPLNLKMIIVTPSVAPPEYVVSKTLDAAAVNVVLIFGASQIPQTHEPLAMAARLTVASVLPAADTRELDPAPD